MNDEMNAQGNGPARKGPAPDGARASSSPATARDTSSRSHLRSARPRHMSGRRRLLRADIRHHVESA